VSRSGLVAGGLAVAVATAGCRGRDRAAVGALADAMGPIDARPGRALTADDLERLAALVVPGAAVEVAARTERDLALVVRSDRARATVTAAGCLACTPPTLAAWEEQRAVLAALWGAENVGGAAAGSLTIAALEVGGLPAITLDVRRGEGRPVAFVGHWNDGVTQLQVVCEAGATISRESLCTSLVATTLRAALHVLRARLEGPDRGLPRRRR
jgi:hypothetical protein